MTYKEAKEFIEEANQYGSVLGLTSITELLKRLGNPQNHLKIIHIGGTNGKGSTGAFITSILTAAGYRVGRYISPTVFSYREKIQISEGINTYYITKEGIQEAIKRIKPICQEMVNDGYDHPTTFEIETAMTFIYLLSQQVDFLVLEVGMGGRLDATNVIANPICTVFTSISMDHMQYLGDSLEKIAQEKAGIIKPKSPVISCNQNSAVIKILKDKADECKSSFIIADFNNVHKVEYSLEETRFIYPSNKEAKEYIIRLIGKHQVKNAILAIEVAKVLNKVLNNHNYFISDEAILSGLYQAKWDGRFQVLDTKPYFIIDGAHNEEAAINLRETVEIYFTNKRLIFMIGVLEDKDYKSILKIMAPLADTIITLTPENYRALASDKLANEARLYCERVFDCGNIEQALEMAYAEAKADNIILAFGSLSFLGSLVKSLRMRKEKTYNKN